MVNQGYSREELDKMKREREAQGYGQVYSPPQGGNHSKSGGLLQYVITAVISVIICFVLSFMGVLPNIVSVSSHNDSVSAIQASINTLNTNLSAVQNTISDTINKNVVASTSEFSNKIANSQAQVDNMADVVKQLSDKLDQYKNQIDQYQSQSGANVVNYNSLTAQLNDINIKIQAIQATLTTYTTYEARIKALEDKVTVLAATPTPTVPVGTDPITFKVTTIGNMPVQITVADNTTVATTQRGNWQLVIKNNTNKAVSQLVLGIGITAYGNADVNNYYVTSTAQLGSNGGAIVWTLYQHYTQTFLFMNGWGYGASQLSIPANSSMTIWITFAADFRNLTTTDYTTYLELEPFVQSYSQ
jgi:hypothetical protein